jgi:glycosyltransferase involved in cell wall biosynthesis
MDETHSDRLPVRVTHLITGLGVGGAESTLYRLLASMDKRRIDNRVVSLTSGGEMAARIRSLDIPVESLDMVPGRPGPAGLWRLIAQLRRTRPNVLQTWLYHADLLGTIAGRLARVPNIAWNIRCSDMGDEYYSGLNGLVVRILASMSHWPNTIVVNSNSGRQLHAEKGYAPRHWNVLPNGFDLDLLKPDSDARGKVRNELSISENVPLIGLVGRLDPIKGHDTFLHAARILIETRPDVHFVLIGEGCEPGSKILAPLMSELPVTQVHLLGRRDDIPALTAALDIATCASRGEAFPNIVGEALACGIPCVATDVGDCADIIGSNGLIVPANNPQAMARAWTSLIDLGASERQQLGDEGRRSVAARYSLASAVTRYENLYVDLANEGSISR